MSETTPATARPPLAQRQTDSILLATLDLLREGGTQAVTTDSVAAKAGVSKATIYRRWRSRSEMIVAAAQQLLTPIAVPDLGSFHAEVSHLVRLRCEDYHKPGVREVLSSIIGAAVEDEQIRTLFTSWVTTQTSTNGGIVERAVRRGELPPDVDRGGVATLMASGIFYRLVVEGREPDEQLTTTVLRVLQSFQTDDTRTPGAGDD